MCCQKRHYIKNFSGVVLPNYSGDVPCSILIADLAAVDIVTDYICQGDDNG